MKYNTAVVFGTLSILREFLRDSFGYSIGDKTIIELIHGISELYKLYYHNSWYEKTFFPSSIIGHSMKATLYKNYISINLYISGKEYIYYFNFMDNFHDKIETVKNRELYFGSMFF